MNLCTAVFYTGMRFSGRQQRTAGFVRPNLDNSERVTPEDMNFDGYTDLKITAVQGNANVYYHCWLWDQKRQEFVFHKGLSNLASPVFDSSAKTVHSFTPVSATDSVEATYTFLRNGKLSPLQIIEQAYDKDGNLIIARQYSLDKKGKKHLVREQVVLQEQGELKAEDQELDFMPFPNATVYKSMQGFSLLLPEGAVARDTTDGVKVTAGKWFVFVNRLGNAVDNLADRAVQTELEEKALCEEPLSRGKIEWAYSTDQTTLNGYDFYRRPFTGVLDGVPVDRGTFYYANINGKHYRVVSAQLTGISDGIILLVKMLNTLVVE
ncbi:hypothetical protein [Sporomusa sp. KB1]|uniref:XAC2610-related protein n=1 Tax=Sporomusa sp. KB1 TaxID=943346 RepID=UPI0011A9841C|nr:hypothetical protein [Sporomusa sp. KB1]TWH48317.1 hypothetical protein Salpa_4465 [Sporomusa sp. KB1]